MRCIYRVSAISLCDPKHVCRYMITMKEKDERESKTEREDRLDRQNSCGDDVNSARGTTGHRVSGGNCPVVITLAPSIHASTSINLEQSKQIIILFLPLPSRRSIRDLGSSRDGGGRTTYTSKSIQSRIRSVHHRLSDRCRHTSS